MKVNWAKIEPNRTLLISGNHINLDLQLRYILGGGILKLTPEGQSWLPPAGIELYLLGEEAPVGLSRKELYLICINRKNFTVIFIKVLQDESISIIHFIECRDVPTSILSEYEIEF